MTIVRGKTTRLQLSLPAGMMISPHQPMEVTLTILPSELGDLSDMPETAPPGTGHDPQ